MTKFIEVKIINCVTINVYNCNEECLTTKSDCFSQSKKLKCCYRWIRRGLFWIVGFFGGKLYRE